jgi:hypothetical protein
MKLLLISMAAFFVAITTQKEFHYYASSCIFWSEANKEGLPCSSTPSPFLVFKKGESGSLTKPGGNCSFWCDLETERHPINTVSGAVRPGRYP